MNNPYSAPIAEMDDVESDDTYKPKIFSINGRIGRLRYIGYTWLVTIVLSFLLGIVLAVAVPAAHLRGGMSLSMTLLIDVPIFATVFVYARRRLHDLDQSGWLAILALIPLINFIFGLYLIFARGTDGPNRFGPAPAKQTNALLWVIIAIPVFIAMIGIVAAIAIPAYQGYVNKARALKLQQQQQQQQQPQQSQ